MSFPRHGEIYRCDVVFKTIEDWGPGAASRWSAPGPSQRTRPKDRAPLIVRDEFPVGYSLAGCSPAEPASASPTTLSMHWGTGAGNCLSANGNLSLVSVSQARGSLHFILSPISRFPRSTACSICATNRAWINWKPPSALLAGAFPFRSTGRHSVRGEPCRMSETLLLAS